MTIDEVFGRIVRAHVVLLTVCILVPIAFVVWSGRDAAPMWDASVRIQGSTDAPVSATEADGVSSRVLALATTPALVGEALHEAGVQDQPAAFAEHRVSAQRLGESPVVELSVRADDRAAAAAIVASLGRQVTEFMNDGDRAHFTKVVQALDEQIVAAQSLRSELVTQLASAGPSKTVRLNAQLTTSESALAQMAQERASLTVTDAMRGRAVVVDGTDPTVERVPDSIVPRAGLALLLGLIVGLTAAAGLEVLRPKIPTGRSLSQLLEVPFLGTAATGRGLSQLPAMMARAARRQGLSTVVLVGVGPASEKMAATLITSVQEQSDEPSEVSKRSSQNGTSTLNANQTGVKKQSARKKRQAERNEDLSGSAGRGGSAVAVKSRPATGSLLGTGAMGSSARPGLAVGTVRFTTLADLEPADEARAGVVLVTPGRMPRSWLDLAQDVLTAGQWPLLGVVETPRSRTSRRLTKQTAAGAGDRGRSA
ncbi:MAG: hypothetical protein WBV37_18540 [Nocardioidaceae bacterium]